MIEKSGRRHFEPLEQVPVYKWNDLILIYFIEPLTVSNAFEYLLKWWKKALFMNHARSSVPIEMFSEGAFDV